MKSISKILVMCAMFLMAAAHAHAQTTVCHLHKESSDIRKVPALSTTGPDARATAFQSIELKGKAAGEYVIKTFVTSASAGDIGVIPAGTAIVFSLWMSKTADVGTMYPMAKLSLNNDTGSPLCAAVGAEALSTTLKQQTFTCYTASDVTMTPSDRLYLSVRANLLAEPGNNRVKAELNIEGALNGNYDSIVAVDRPTVNSLSPISGTVGTTVAITGKSFGLTQGTGTVAFNGIPATVNSWSDSTIVASVPQGVSLSTGLVTVTVSGIQSNGLPFSVLLPTGYITTVAGNGATTFSGDGGPAPLAGIDASNVVVDGHGNLYIASEGHHRVRKVDPNGVITTVAGTGAAGYSGDGGLAIDAQISSPRGIAVDAQGDLYIAEGNRVRKVSAGGTITTLVSGGVTDVAVDSMGNILVADATNNTVRKIDPNGISTIIAGTGAAGYSGDGGQPLMPR